MHTPLLSLRSSLGILAGLSFQRNALVNVYLSPFSCFLVVILSFLLSWTAIILKIGFLACSQVSPFLLLDRGRVTCVYPFGLGMIIQYYLANEMWQVITEQAYNFEHSPLCHNYWQYCIQRLLHCPRSRSTWSRAFSQPTINLDHECRMNICLIRLLRFG